MAVAARVGDATGHPGVIGPPLGVPTVFIGGQPAATVGTPHTCTMPPPAGPHGMTPIAQGSATVFIEGRPAARVGDVTACGSPIVGPGCPTVLIGG